MQSVLITIGNLLMIWSGIERQINTLICNYHPLAPDKLRRRGLPASLGEKIKYLVEVAKDERLSADLRQNIRLWVPEINRLRSHRDLLVHGNFFQVGRSTRWRVQLLTLRANAPVFEDRYFDNDELQEASRQIADLSNQIATVLNPIFFGENWRTAPRPS